MEITKTGPHTRISLQKKTGVGRVPRLKNKIFSPNSKSEKNSPSVVKDYHLRLKSCSKKYFAYEPSPPISKADSSKASPRTPRLSQVPINKILLPEPLKLRRFKSSSKRRSQYFSQPTTSEKSLRLKPNLDLQSQKEKLIDQIRLNYSKHKIELKTTLDFYKIHKMLGEGTFGKVYLASQVLTGTNVALKVINPLTSEGKISSRKILREILMLKQLQSPYIIKLLEYFEHNNSYYIVMEYMKGGDLLKYLKTQGRLPEVQCKTLFYQILEAVKYTHDQNILHRDIKLDNILLNDSVSLIKLCDFGVSRVIKKGEILTDHCGTPAYLAPEIILDKGYGGFGSDLWSLGVLLYAMCCGTVPFKGNTLSDLHKSILLCKFDLPDYLSPELKDLLPRFLQIIPNNRIRIENAQMHPWFLTCSHPTRPLLPFHHSFDPTILKAIESFGYPMQFILNSLEYNYLSHISAVYFCLVFQ